LSTGSARTAYSFWMTMMIAFLANFPSIFAQDAGGGSIWQTVLFIAPIPFLFYFLLIRPQQQQEQKRRSLLDTMKKNDKVVTTSGMYGTVMSVDAIQDKVVLRVDDEKGVMLAFTKASIARVIDSAADKSAEST
jgi:preprotein translocase subunit YajC